MYIMHLEEIRGLQMLPIFHVLAVFCAATFLSLRIGKLSGEKWTVGFLIGGALLVGVTLPKLVPGLINTGFYQLILGGKIDGMLVGIAGIISVVPCLPRLRVARTRFLVVAFLAISVFRSAILPSACFYLNRDELTSLSGHVDPDGVYLQTTGYTCGPAAAATVLNAYGIDASEGEIALGTGCNSYSGTRSLDLVSYINTKHGEDLRAEYRYVDEVDSLKHMKGFFIAEVKASTFTDHFVVIMGFNGDSLQVADPSLGSYEMRTATFSEGWRRKVIVVSRRES
jgi:hypothetical protein